MRIDWSFPSLLSDALFCWIITIFFQVLISIKLIIKMYCGIHISCIILRSYHCYLVLWVQTCIWISFLLSKNLINIWKIAMVLKVDLASVCILNKVGINTEWLTIVRSLVVQSWLQLYFHVLRMLLVWLIRLNRYTY